MTLFQDTLIDIFAVTYKLTSKIPEKLRNLAIFGCLFILSACTYNLTVAPILLRTDLHAAGMGFYGFFLMIIMVILAVPGPLERVRWNKWIVYPYFFAAAYMTLMALEHYVGRGYGFYALSLLIVFPAIYLVWENRGDYERYLTWISWCNVILGVALIIASYMFAPIGQSTLFYGRYCSLTWNPNRFATLMVLLTAACLYLASKRNKLAPIFMIITGAACHLIWISGCRAALIIILIQFVGWIVTILRFDAKEQLLRTLLFISISGTLVIAGFVVSRWTLNNEVILVADRGCMLVENEDEKVTGLATQEGNSQLTAGERFTSDGQSADKFSGGRLQIWSYYIKGMNIRGNDMQDFELVLPSGNAYHNAHNTIIEIAYRFGVPAGIAYTIFMLTVTFALIKACLVLAKKRYSIGIALYTVAYFVFAMTDVMTLSFERGPVLTFCLIIGGLFSAEMVQKENKEDAE